MSEKVMVIITFIISLKLSKRWYEWKPYTGTDFVKYLSAVALGFNLSRTLQGIFRIYPGRVVMNRFRRALVYFGKESISMPVIY